MILSILYIFLLFLLYILIKLIIIIYKKFIRKPYDLASLYKKGSYVLVTGATNGIGKEFCIQFAKLGFNIILVSRDQSKLEQVSKEIESKYKVKTEIIIFDFTKNTSIDHYINSFQSNPTIKNLDIRILINNIGLNKRELFNNYSLEEIANLINANVLSQSLLTNIFLNKFLKIKEKCAIINMSSFNSEMPLILSSMYCSTKVYDEYLLKTIAYENKNKNIDFLVVKPLYVDTPSRAGHKREFKPITAEQCVTGALEDLGYELETYGHWKHCVQGVLMGLVPEKIKNYFRYRNNIDKFKEKIN